jgi:hypothetical protein
MPGTPLTMSLEITDDNEPTASYVIEVFSDQVGGAVSNKPVQTLPVTGNGTHTVSGVTYLGGQQYVYLRVKQNGTDTAWTAPVWLDPMGVPGGGGSGLSMSLVVDVQAAPRVSSRRLPQRATPNAACQLVSQASVASGLDWDTGVVARREWSDGILSLAVALIQGSVGGPTSAGGGRRRCQTGLTGRASARSSAGLHSELP